MADDAGAAGKSGNFWDPFVFAVKGEKGTATEDGWLSEVSAAGGQAVNGRFELDPESAESIVKTARWITTELQKQAQTARELTSTKPPAEDPGSMHFNDVAVTMLELGADRIKAEWEYSRDLAAKLEKALNVYKESDEQASTDVKNAGGGEGGGLF